MLSNHMNLIHAVDAEIDRAMELHPNWPDDIIHAAGIVCEEAGETMQAALDHVYFGTSRDDIRIEAIQTAATCFRLLAALDDANSPK